MSLKEQDISYLEESMNTAYLQSFTSGESQYQYYDIEKLSTFNPNFKNLPYSIRVLAENLLRNYDGVTVTESHIKALCNWHPGFDETVEIPYFPGRVLMQDFTGVPAVVDLAAMRDAVAKFDVDPAVINPKIPVSLVIDHSVQVDNFGSKDALVKNVELEYQRNMERYSLLKWGQGSFKNFGVVPPNIGICHQINLEFLSSLTLSKSGTYYPDTLIGTDSHTPMINGVGVMAWGVGGIEAEAVMLGQPYFMKIPKVIGIRLTGEKNIGVTATDVVLKITERLRQYGVVEKFLEFFGSGMESLSVLDRATISNMTPEFGATLGFFPVDEKTIDYMKNTGRESQSAIAKAYYKASDLFYDGDKDVAYTDVIDIDLSAITPCVAGPSRPQDNINLRDLSHLDFGEHGVSRQKNDPSCSMKNGSIVVAAITSCTSTSNAAMMFGAGLLAKKANDLGLMVCKYIKTSFAPGSRVVEAYLKDSGLMNDLESVGFHITGFGCTTCIGNSGPLAPDIEEMIKEKDMNFASILSGNRNFEARIHPLIKSNFLASPLLVIAFAIAGRIDFDFETEPLGQDHKGSDIFLRDIWPKEDEIETLVSKYVTKTLFKDKYSSVYDGDDKWRALSVMDGETFHWERESTYIREPEFFKDFKMDISEPLNIDKARVLMVLGDSVTTDHISPAGAIGADSPAGRYLKSEGKRIEDFNTYGARRGNHEVMVRGTFANVRIRNKVVAPQVGGFAVKYPEGDVDYVYYVANRYKDENRDLVILAGKEYGTGSSRDWAAKGTAMLGIKAVIAESYERIHKSNLIGMGVLPLQFVDGQNVESLGLTGSEEIDIDGVDTIAPGKTVSVRAISDIGTVTEFKAVARLDTDIDVTYYKHGGILQYVMRDIIKKNT